MYRRKKNLENIEKNVEERKLVVHMELARKKIICEC
jgi:hypothetical protein